MGFSYLNSSYTNIDIPCNITLGVDSPCQLVYKGAGGGVMFEFWMVAVFLLGPLVFAWLHFFYETAVLRLNYELRRAG
jgi:hypothetical protein